ncbi:MAG: CRTAC1 family protein, partial [Bacteroidota bacterium]
MFRVSSFVLLLVLAGCASGPSKEGRPSIPAEQVFTSLPASYTGVSFENQLEDTEEFNVFTYRNYFNGGGVGIGDFNGDGRPDVYLSANQLPNELYLNEGDFFFREVAEEAGVDGKRAWATGVAVADVNADGLLDLYVCNSGNLNGDDKANELFINQGPDPDGVPTFSEEAEAYGLADEGYGTHAAFFDYDLDGDLDLYLLNNSFKPASSFGLKNIRDVRDELGGDKLFRNDNGRFVDVSESAGIFGSEIAFGLGVTVGDLDQDGYPDIYVSNDFFERDYLYINNQDGTFREVLEERMPVISLSSMGADMADVDNDGRLDLFVTDMLPESDRRVKTTSIFETWNVYQTKLRNDYHHQLMRNMLHLNDGDATFTEVGQMAGVSATDWSWGALFVDLDLDGRKDIYVANGIYKDLTDQDFIDFFASEETFEMFKENDGFNFMELLDRIPSEPIANYAFQNLGDGAFTNVAAEWGLDTPGFSNGAAYADLDLDGDLDLVVNNTNAPALVLRNNTIREQAGDAPAWVRVHLKGSAGNPFGIGAGVTVFAGETQHFLEHMPMRGFQSSVDYALTFGLADTQGIDSVRVEWPGGAVQTVSDVALRSTLTLEQANASYRDDAEQAPTT